MTYLLWFLSIYFLCSFAGMFYFGYLVLKGLRGD